MKHAPWTARIGFCITTAFGLVAGGLLTAPAAEAKKVSAREGQTLVIENGDKKPLKEKLSLTTTIEVLTNATYKVGGGEPRKLADGAVLDSQGMLTSPDGTIEPVFDHITMRNGQVFVFKDGQSKKLQDDLILPQGIRIKPTGEMRMANGQLSRMIDGRILDLAGNAVASSDTVTLREGKVYVQKDGSQFSLRPNQSFMMNEGTKVFGDGRLLKRNGDTMKLTEGQIVKLDGVVPSK